MAELKKKLPIGIEFFKDMRTKGFYYVDKTGFIVELLNSWGMVNLFTRPRRFGKSLNMDMLKAFFKIGADGSLFHGLAIEDEKMLCQQYMGQYPVISISLKDVSGPSYEAALKNMSRVIRKEVRRHQFLLESDRLSRIDKESLSVLFAGYLEADVQEESLELLSEMLCKHYGKKTLIFIDEYDVPLDKAYERHYYPQMVHHIRAMFSGALKSNEYLEFAVITGCLRIAEESIFTGLNNFKVRTISDVQFAEYFGFTDDEVKTMLSYYGLEDKFALLKEWYDGYRFGNRDVYCPWDVINQCDKFLHNPNAPMEGHWENSSSNGIIQTMIENSTATTKAQIEALISGHEVEKVLVPELTYTDLDSKDEEIRQTYLWSVLLATGYLTQAGMSQNGLQKLVIPNKEVQGIYEKKIRSWFKIKIISNTERWRKFCIAVKSGDAAGVQELFNSFMADSISIRDTCVKKRMKENFYHGMLLGLLQAEESWIVKSNRESGIGYLDIQLEVPTERTGCVIEVKYAEQGAFDSACQEAMRQIDECGYVALLKQDGMERIHKFGIACYKKSCKVIYDLET